MPDTPTPSVCTIERAGISLAYKARAGRSPTVVFLPGFSSNMEGTKATAIDDWARARGQAYLRFDYAGHGASGGRFTACTLSSWLADATAVIDAASTDHLILVGSSMGGWIMTLLALARPERVAGLVGLAAAPDFTSDIIWPTLDAEQRILIESQGYLDFPSDYADTPTRVTWDLVRDGNERSVLGRDLDIDIPVRLIHGLADTDVPWAQSRRLAEAIGGPDVTLTLIKDGDHRLSRPQDIARMCAAVREICDRAL